MGHEDYRRQDSIELPSNRAFGYVFVVVFTVIGFFPLLFLRPPFLWALGVAAAFLLVTLLSPNLLTHLNRWWLRFGLLLHRFVSPIILGFMFFVVITPMGLLMRAMRKDPLRLRRQNAIKSYWIDREPPGPAPETLKDQF